MIYRFWRTFARVRKFVSEEEARTRIKTYYDLLQQLAPSHVALAAHLFMISASLNTMRYSTSAPCAAATVPRAGPYTAPSSS